MPKVSVLMPVYKTPDQFLKEAIESILNQTFTDFELIVLDDCPEHPKEEFIRTFHDPRISYYKNEKNLGISQSRNKLIQLAKGEYLAIHDHDDVSMPTRFEKQVAYLDVHPSVGVVASNYYMMHARKEIVGPEEDLEIKTALVERCILPHPVSMIRKSVLEENNIYYKEKYFPSEDYKLFSELIRFTNFYNIQEVLMHYRDWEENTSNKKSDQMYLSTLLIRNDNRIAYPHLYQRVVDKETKEYRIRLFGFIPILKILYRKDKINIYLFYFIPIFKCRIGKFSDD